MAATALLVLLAATPPPFEPPPEEIVVTATRTRETTYAVPQPVTVISAEDAALASRGTWAEGLGGLPGLALQRTSPGQGNALVRGLKGSEVLHLVDGFRLNMAIFRNAPNNYLALVDPMSIERVEVSRGASSALYGSDAMGGVISLSTGEPTLSAEGWRAGARVQAAASSADRALEGRVAADVASERVALRAGTTWQWFDRVRTGDGVRQPFTAYRARGGDAKLLLAPAAGHHVVLGASWFEQPSTPRYDELVAGYDRAEPGYARFLFEPGSRLFAFGRYRVEADAGAFDRGELGVAYQRFVDDRRTQRLGGTDEDRERNRSGLLLAQAHLARDLGVAGTLLYGVEASRDEVRSSRTRRSLTTGDTETVSPRFPDGAVEQSLAAYVGHDWRPGPRFDATGGLRASLYSVDVPAQPDRPGVHIEPFDVSGHLGASAALGEHVRGVARVGRGFRAPNVFDLGVFGPRPGNRFSIPNPRLAPETVWTVDLGARVRAQPAWLEAFAFAADYTDKIVEVDTGELTSAGERIVQGRNASRVRYYGLEGAVALALGDGVAARAGLTWVYGTEYLGGEVGPADRIPPLGGSVSVRWDPVPRLRLEAVGDFAARQDRLSARDLEDPRIDPTGTDGYVLLGARARWAPVDALELSVRVENLTDASYREHGSGIDGPGLNVVLVIDWRA